MRGQFGRMLLLAALVLGASGAGAQSHKLWRDAFLTRVELLALLQTLNANLLASRSATAALERWCADHDMSAEPKIVARRMTGVDKEPSAETRERLRVEPAEPVKYRRVQLACGDHVLSEADNWYVPGRLSAEMNHTLENTDTPFGKAVKALQPFRRTIEMKMRWSPLPEGWETKGLEARADGGAHGAIEIPHEVFEHRAILYADQKPFSEVHETYTNEVLDFNMKANTP